MVGLGRHCALAGICGALSLISCFNSAEAQQFLGQMTAAQCVQAGGTPDSSITSDDDPDPVRNCWRHYASGADAAGAGGGNGAVVTPVQPAVPAGPSDAATALQAGGAALNFLGQILSTMDSGSEAPVNPYTEAQKQYDAAAEAERQRVRQEAHDFNERGRRAAEAGKTASAMVNFQEALERSEQIGDYENSQIYRDNMNLMKAYIAYDFGVLGWKNGSYDIAKKRFGEALVFAREAHRESLVSEMRTNINALAETVADPAAKSAAQQNCMLINGESLCN